MAGDGPLTISIGPADEKVATSHLSAMAGELKNKRKATDSETAAGEECAAKRKVVEAVELALEKKMARLPQEEVHRILEHVVDDRVPRNFQALKRQNPSLLPSPEEEADTKKVVLYTAARVFYAGGESYRRFQAFVRDEYEKRGYVEVEEEFLARRAQLKAYRDKARARVFKKFAAGQDEDGD